MLGKAWRCTLVMLIIAPERYHQCFPLWGHGEPLWKTDRLFFLNSLHRCRFWAVFVVWLYEWEWNSVFINKSTMEVRTSLRRECDFVVSLSFHLACEISPLDTFIVLQLWLCWCQHLFYCATVTFRVKCLNNFGWISINYVSNMNVPPHI